jgi:hypothetical protein
MKPSARFSKETKEGTWRAKKRSTKRFMHSPDKGTVHEDTPAPFGFGSGLYDEEEYDHSDD